MEVQDGAATNDTPDLASGIYVLRDLIKDITLSSEGDTTPAQITCVDVWNGNVYIGTSTGEVLHYVSIPPDPADESGEPSYIFATKFEPPFTTKQEGCDAGVKQILVLPDADKACILCNGTLTFYTLPELSPAYGEKIKQSGCLWVGGLDANQHDDETNANAGTVVVICLKQRLRLIRIGKDARKIRDIELGGVVSIQRRGNLACVADGRTYSLLDVVNHRKNELFQISSANAVSKTEQSPPLSPSPTANAVGQSRIFSAGSPTRQGRSHERNVSLGGESKDSTTFPSRSASRQLLSPPQPSSREPSVAPSAEEPTSYKASVQVQPKQDILAPHIVTPASDAFLLTTGTKPDEPGVGVFINLDGDPTSGTLEFTSYPESVVLDSDSELGGQQGVNDFANTEGYVLAIVRRFDHDRAPKAVEIQPCNQNTSGLEHARDWIALPTNVSETATDSNSPRAGLRIATSSVELAAPEIATSLRLRRVDLEVKTREADSKRNREEDEFAKRFALIRGNVLLHTDSTISWLTRNPLILRLESQLRSATERGDAGKLVVDFPAVQQILNSIRGQEAHNELDFLTLTYIRQRASLFMFGHVLSQAMSNAKTSGSEHRLAEEALIAGEIDPRTILSLLPSLAGEIEEGEQGIWIHDGLRMTIETIREGINSQAVERLVEGPEGIKLLSIVSRYLFAWRKKKGFGSVADEAHVFKSVDAALLHVLLLLDQRSPRGPATSGSVRAELNDVVDHGVDCFDRAVELFEQFHRLYMLSRLYQHRKSSAQVLHTWKRILEGEHDAGGEFIEGEQNLRRYLSKISVRSLVEEYALWLANRNPKLGVQIFADDNSRVKFDPREVVPTLKDQAPDAVKDYLEHLVFGKNHVQYVNELIAFYLDTVLRELESSPESKSILTESYENYRALRPPKPTYRQFITDNALDAEWWRNRLRLLQLIGGSHGAASSYNVHALRERLATYSDELVPEMIILNGREGKHEEALRLLTHGLGDYDTAIRYCLLGGRSIFHPGSGLAADQPPPSKEEQAKLFDHLLHEFLRIDDLSGRLERTSELLERFAPWFDIAEVLALVPDEWSVTLVAGFLVPALRRLVKEKNEVVLTKALASSQNLKKSVDHTEKVATLGPTVVRGEIETG